MHLYSVLCWEWRLDRSCVCFFLFCSNALFSSITYDEEVTIDANARTYVFVPLVRGGVYSLEQTLGLGMVVAIFSFFVFFGVRVVLIV